MGQEDLSVWDIQTQGRSRGIDSPDAKGRMEMLSCFICMKFLLVMLTSFSFVTVTIAAGPGSDEVKRRTLKIEDHPCFSEAGPRRSICRLQQGRGAIEPRAEGGVGRRVQALLKAKEVQRSHLVPKWMSASRARSIDLRSTKTQLNDPTRNPQKFRDQEPQAPKTEARKGSLIQRRALGGTRQDATAIDCRAMEGLRLLACLRERGIEITPRTVDSETWELYRLQQPAPVKSPTRDESEEVPVQE